MITAQQFESLHEALESTPCLGTFLEFNISMGGKPSARYTHGRIDFDDFEDLERWLNLTPAAKWEEATASRRLK